MSYNDKDDMGNNALEVLWCLFKQGPTWDGNIPSKVGRDYLIDMGLATRRDGWATLTSEGLQAALRLKMDLRKGY